MRLPTPRRRLQTEVWSRGPSFPGFGVMPTGTPRAICIGPDPVRIAIVGGGLGAGFGAATHDEALTGQLAVVLHRELQRGVVVTSRAAPRMAIDDVPASLGAAGALTFHAIVYTPNISSAVTVRPKAWRRRAETMVQHLRATGGDELPIVLTGLPPFRFSGPSQQRVEQERLELERLMQAFAAEHEHVVHAPVTTSPDLEVDTDYTVFYRSFAEDVARALVPVLA